MPNPADPTIEATRSKQPKMSLGSKLCTSCGLCCTGAIHNRAVLEEDEIPAARALGLPVLDAAEPLFGLPCPKLENNCCTIYGSRPKVCSRYKCQLLLDVESSAVPLDEALAHVRSAKDLLRQLKDVAPTGMSLRDTRLLALNVPTDGPEPTGRTRMLVKLRSIAFQLYLDRVFRNSRDGKLFELTAVAEMEKA